MRKVLIGLAIVTMLGCAAFADLGFYTEANLDFVPGTTNYVPVVEGVFGWESPTALLGQTASATFGANVYNPNIVDFSTDFGMGLDLGFNFGHVLGLDITYDVFVDRTKFNQGKLEFSGWSAFAGLTWTPTTYSEIETGLVLEAPKVATPFLRARFDF